MAPPSEEPSERDGAPDEVTLEEVVEAAFPAHGWRCSRGSALSLQTPQLWFVCRTCRLASAGGAVAPAPWAGLVCAACHDACHSEHDTLELWNKRDLVCQCDPARCELSDANDELENERMAEAWAARRDQHNWDNRYCRCDREYTGAEDGDMYQCDVCQDWFHERCLDASAWRDAPPQALLVCRDCLRREPRLHGLVRAASGEGQEVSAPCVGCVAAANGLAGGSEDAFVSTAALRRRTQPCPRCAAWCAERVLSMAAAEAATDPTGDAAHQAVPRTADAVLEIEMAHSLHTAKRRLYRLFHECQREGKVVTGEAMRAALEEIRQELIAEQQQQQQQQQHWGMA